MATFEEFRASFPENNNAETKIRARLVSRFSLKIKYVKTINGIKRVSYITGEVYSFYVYEEKSFGNHPAKKSSSVKDMTSLD